MIHLTTGRGIVLHHDLAKSYITILDDHDGKLQAWYRKKKISPGSYISYEYKKKATIFLQNIMYLYLPQMTNFTDLVGLHHLLELCRHLLLPGFPLMELVRFIRYLCMTNHKLFTDAYKWLLLAQLILILDISYEHDSVCNECLLHLQKCSVDKLEALKIHLKCYNKLAHWVYCSLSEYVSLKKMKTLTFFTMVEKI
jgi:hypothetical protein